MHVLRSCCSPDRSRTRLPTPARGLLIGFLAATTLAPACDRRPDPADPGAGFAGRGEPRDVLLITFDTLRHDATGFSGAGRVETPSLDALASGGRVYSFTHAHAVVTLPSHASILTGLYPYQHGIRDNAGYVLDQTSPTLATLLRAAGYRTAAFISAFPLDRRYGLAGGFDLYDDEYDGYQGRGFTPAERPGSQTVARALAWWNENRGQRRFAWVHLFTPHFPYEPAEPFASRHRDAPYYGDVAMADAELEPLLRTVLDGPDRDAAVVFTSDHGESLGEHGERTHGLFAYEATLRVPLVVRAEGRVEPGVSTTPARHVDVLPTILELLGLEPPAGLPGRSLLSAKPPDHDASSYFESLSAYLNRGWAPLHGRLEGRSKAILLPIPELYELGRDPQEADNLARRSKRRLDEMLARLPAGIEPGERTTPSREEIERLRKLGYTAGSAPLPAEFDESTDPKNLVQFDNLLDAALTSYHAGDVQQAIRQMTELIERQPDMPLAYSHLAFFYTDLGQIKQAIAWLQRAVDRGISNESIHRKLALNRLRVGEAGLAWEALKPHTDSADPETQSALGRIAAVAGRHDEARARFRRALELDPTYPTALLDQGTLLMMQQRFEEARPSIERALEQDPYLAEGWNALGAIRSTVGDTAGAIEAWQRALEVDPRLPDALWNLASALSLTGDDRGAVKALERYVTLVQGGELAQGQAKLRQLRGRIPAGH